MFAPLRHPKLCGLLLGTSAIVAVLAATAIWTSSVAPPSRSQQQTSTPPPRPNIVLVVVDTLRADALSTYGYSQSTTPFLQELSNKAVVFERAYSASTWTPSATASLLSSVLPQQHHVDMDLFREGVRGSRVPAELPLLQESLANAGYRTFAITDNFNIQAASGYARGFHRFDALSEHIEEPYAGTDAVADRVREWRAALEQGPDPYFLYLHFMDPHAPYHCRSPYCDDPDVGDRVRYDSEVSSVDRVVGELYEEFGWAGSSVFVFTADHGEGFGEHGFTGHPNEMFDELLRVPLVVSAAGRFPATRVAAPVSTLDLFPTLAGLAGAQAPPHAEGEDLTTVLRGHASPSLWDRPLFATRGDTVTRTGRARVIIRGPHKLILTDDAPDRLFDVVADPGETVDRSQLEPALVHSLRGDLEAFELRAVQFPPEYAHLPAQPSALQQQQLRALGYAN